MEAAQFGCPQAWTLGGVPTHPQASLLFLLQATPFHLARAQQPVLPESAPGHVLLEAAAQKAVLPLRWDRGQVESRSGGTESPSWHMV